MNIRLALKEDAAALVGEAEFFADSHEEARAQIAAGFLDELKSVAFGVMQGDARIAQHQDGLFLVASLNAALHSV